jgi:peptidoglycan/LPS O-acetylase OafA/YrhL
MDSIFAAVAVASSSFVKDAEVARNASKQEMKWMLEVAKREAMSTEWIVALSSLAVALLASFISSFLSKDDTSKRQDGYTPLRSTCCFLSRESSFSEGNTDRAALLAAVSVPSEAGQLTSRTLETCEDMEIALSSLATPSASSRPPEEQTDRFSFGLARCVASIHVVVGHLYARGRLPDVYVFHWGFTWVPWFFMLSGFILCTAELRKPRSEGVFDYVSRRLVTIYPLYAFSVLFAFGISQRQGFSDRPPWILVLQAWLLQAWIPQATEFSLQMQCWFLSCLAFYWLIFPFLMRRVSEMSLKHATMDIIFLFLVPSLFVLVPDFVFGDEHWYRYHTWGHMRTPTDVVAVILKFNPFCYLHVFAIGMILARIRLTILSGYKGAVADVGVRLTMDLLAPIGYLGLVLVFTLPAVEPPSAKLSARIFWLLPLQAAILLGLAGLPGHPLPLLARALAPLNFLESYSYAVYVMQFICMALWSFLGIKVFALPFFIFLISCAILAVVIIQKPSEALWRRDPRKAALVAPTIISLTLVAWSMSGKLKSFGTGPQDTLPSLLRPVDGILDVRLPLTLPTASDTENFIINPSIVFLYPGSPWLTIVARRHGRSSRSFSGLYGNRSVTIMEELWLSEILIGEIRLNTSSWITWSTHGSLPIPEVQMLPWRGLRNDDGQTWLSPNLCHRETWLPKNSTLMRLIVTGPEDPKAFGYKEQLQLAFNSYPPEVYANGSCKVRPVSQMYLSLDVNTLSLEEANTGKLLKCGRADRPEKNWIPFESKGSLYFVYSVLPHVVVETFPNGECGRRYNSIFPPLAKIQAKSMNLAYRGSAQAIFVNDPKATPNLPQPHFLALLHATNTSVRQYQHYAYRFSADPPFRILQVSSELPLQKLRPSVSEAPIAFASGLARHRDEVIITYAAGDRDPRALFLSLRKLDEFFRLPFGHLTA